MSDVIGAGTTIMHATTQAGLATGTLVSKIVNITPAATTVHDSETSTYDDTADQFIPTFKNGGEYEFEIKYDTAATAVLFPLVGTMLWWQVTLPDTHKWQLQGFINNYQPALPMKQKATEKLKIKITGIPTYL